MRLRSSRVTHVSLEDEIARLQGVCARFEAQYGVGSEQLFDVFRRPDGTLDETDDFHRWERAYHQLRAMTASSDD